MTLWEYIPQTSRLALTPTRLAERVRALAQAMTGYRGELPILGAWRLSGAAADELAGHPDGRVQSLLERYTEWDRRLASFGPQQLVPCHGDAHAGNLLAGPDGWYWTDFEDVSLMPKFWDLASLTANPLLLRGHTDPLARAVTKALDIQKDPESWRLALATRATMSTLVNVWWAHKGFGDGSFAEGQLARIGPFLGALERD